MTVEHSTRPGPPQHRWNRRGGGRRAREQRTSVLAVVGEMLLTAGALVLAFVGWQLWILPAQVAAEQATVAASFTQSNTSELIPVADPEQRADPGDPAVSPRVGNAEQFGNVIIPRFGPTYMRPLLEGIGYDDVLEYGVGHYPDTQMPGEVGNFAVAAHRTGAGDPFINIDKLQVGDAIYVETADGWYEYRFRDYEYVDPEAVEVLFPVPKAPGVAPVDRIMTLTSCNPLFSRAERIIAYAVFETWYPLADGVPPEIADLYEVS